MAITDTLNIAMGGCKYNLLVPDGWDTIPQSVLKEKELQIPVSVAIYPVKQKEYFEGNYILFSFMPAAKMLTNFTFDEISKGLLAQQSANANAKIDTLTVQYVTSEVIDTTYSIRNYYQISGASQSLEYCQVLYVARSGFINALIYRKPNGVYSINQVNDLLAGAVSVQPPYKYAEPSRHSFSWLHVVSSCCIGAITYCVIFLVLKYKKRRNK